MALWGGRFSDAPADAVFALSRSVQFDWRLAPYDLRSSLAHLRVLKSSGLLTPEAATKIEGALKDLISDVASAKFLPSAEDEDVHSALERGLMEKIGETGGALRAGRSRNDQVATDLKLYAIDHMLDIAQQIGLLQQALIAKATEYGDAPAPGFTHMQHAQPILFGHELAKHIHAFARDIERIQDWLARTSVSPLGSGALAGSGLCLQPEITAKDLGFTSSSANSIDGVSDRDFVAEALFIISLVGVHLSRIGEEWCIWATTEFGWAKVADAYSTGSSIMPQKKNPDMAELARGKAGRLIGNLTGVLAMLKGLPFAYNRDLQEDKEPLFDSIDTLRLVLPAVTGMVATTAFDRAKMLAAAPQGFSLATEVADFLVRAGVPFAVAHEAAGKCVAICESKNIELHELSDSDFTTVNPKLTSEVRKSLTVEGAIASRTTVGATGKAALAKQLAEATAAVKATQSKISTQVTTFSEMMGQ
ncbi:argininosuccinate lyase [Actinobacteria bacterium IMCC26103]|nr:argininosuccinate lyase [Actinobacteria bacterium IMCC26103]